MTYAFDTQRLRVFIDRVKPTDHNTVRTLFIAFRTDDDKPMVAANMLTWFVPALNCWYVDWHEVASVYRRQGIGREFRRGIEKHLGAQLHSEGATEDGRLFLAAVANPDDVQASQH